LHGHGSNSSTGPLTILPARPNSKRIEINNLRISSRAVAGESNHHFWHRKQEDPSHDHPVLTVGLIAGVGAVITAMQIRAHRLFAEGGFWLLSVLGATTGILVATGGGSAWTCLVSGAGVAYLAWTSWKLATAGASFLRTD